MYHVAEINSNILSQVVSEILLPREWYEDQRDFKYIEMKIIKF